MGTRIWLRLRRWFGAERSVSTLDLVFARFGEPGEGRPWSRSQSRRETLHPLQGWREEARHGLTVADIPSRMGLRPLRTQSVKSRTDGRGFSA